RREERGEENRNDDGIRLAVLPTPRDEPRQENWVVRRDKVLEDAQWLLSQVEEAGPAVPDGGGVVAAVGADVCEECCATQSKKRSENDGCDFGAAGFLYWPFNRSAALSNHEEC